MSLERTTGSDRRFSVKSYQGMDGDESSEIESSRKKLQRHAIEHGATRVELWSAALKLVKCSRILHFIAPTGKIDSSGGGMFASLTQPSESPSSPPDILQVYEPKAPRAIDHMVHCREQGQSKQSYADKLITPKRDLATAPSAALTEVTNSPTTPKLVFKPHRKGAFSEGTDLPAVTQRLQGLVIQDHSVVGFLEYQRNKIANTPGKGTTYRDSRNPGCLPRAIIERIVSLVGLGVGAEGMTEKQKNAAFDWGSDRATLATEMEWRKKDNSSQVWMLLDSIGCLAYGQ